MHKRNLKTVILYIQFSKTNESPFSSFEWRLPSKYVPIRLQIWSVCSLDLFIEIAWYNWDCLLLPVLSKSQWRYQFFGNTAEYRELTAGGSWWPKYSPIWFELSRLRFSLKNEATDAGESSMVPDPTSALIPFTPFLQHTQYWYNSCTVDINNKYNVVFSSCYYDVWCHIKKYTTCSWWHSCMWIRQLRCSKVWNLLSNVVS